MSSRICIGETHNVRQPRTAALNRHWIAYGTTHKEQKLRDVNYMATI